MALSDLTTDPSAAAATAGSRPVATRTAQRWPSLWVKATWTLLALGGLLTAYRMAVVHFSGISLFFDEAQYWDWSRQLEWGYYSKPPVIAALVGLSTTLFGSGVLGVKAVSMLVYLGTAWSMVGLARALWPTSSGVRTGVVAGALFITAPMAGVLGMAASTDAPLLLCWTLASWALWRAQVTNRLGQWVLCGLAIGVGLLSKYTMAAFALTMAWALWGVHGPRRGIRRIGPWVSALVALAVLSPNIVWNVQWDFPTLQHTAEITTSSTRNGGLTELLTFVLGQCLMIGPFAVGVGLWLMRNARPAPTPWAASAQVEPAARSPQSSAFHLASVTSYRFLVAMSAPLLAVAMVQSLRSGAHVNWAAPALIGLFMLIASRLSAPLLPLAAPRADRWLWGILACNLLLTAAVVHTRDVVGPTLPSRYDALVRMRGWHEAFAQLTPALQDPRVAGLPVVADKRLLLAQASYEWRDQKVSVFAWNPHGGRSDHYQLRRSLPQRVGQDVLILSDTPDPVGMLAGFAFKKELAHGSVPVGPGRSVDLHLFLARGWVGTPSQPLDAPAAPNRTNPDAP